ncbi:MAG: zinc dependent phospholipase C family protein [Gemmatimonadota bacterium]
MSRRVLLAGVVLGAVAILALPLPALAWGPAAHTQFGVEILRSLNLFPSPVAALLSSFPIDFLYGNLAADISMAKKYAPVGRHCHHWHVAREIQRKAGDDPRLRAAMLGYLSHLAADVLAHNRFVPRMLLLTSSTRALGHSYWEHRMDADVGADCALLARWVVTDFDHARTDRMFRDYLSSTLFSFGTNRRLFRGMIRISGNESWQAIFDTVVDNSRWDLSPRDVDLWVRHAFELVADFLIRDGDSIAAAGDPIGESALFEAKKIRRRVLMAGGWRTGRALQATADHHFALPTGPTPLWEARGGTRDAATHMLERAMAASGSHGSELFEKTAPPRPAAVPSVTSTAGNV